MGDVVSFDPAKLKERISDIVKGTFLDLIPPDAFKLMVDTEIKAFFERPSVRVSEKKGDYNRVYLERVEEMTPFQEMVRIEVIGQIKKKLIETLCTEEWQGAYYGDNKTGVMAAAITKELVPELVTAMFKGMTQNIVCEIRNQLQR